MSDCQSGSGQWTLRLDSHQVGINSGECHWHMTETPWNGLKVRHHFSPYSGCYAAIDLHKTDLYKFGPLTENKNYGILWKADHKKMVPLVAGAGKVLQIILFRANLLLDGARAHHHSSFLCRYLLSFQCLPTISRMAL